MFEDPHPSSSSPTPPPASPPPRGPNLFAAKGAAGASLLAAFVLLLVATVLGAVAGLRNLDVAPLVAESLITVILSALLGFCAFLIWQGHNEPAGVFAIVVGIVFLVLGPEAAGLFAVLGGVLALVARRVPDLTA